MKLGELLLNIKRHSTEVGCLLSEGYLEISTFVIGHGQLFTKMRHKSNGNFITISTTREFCAIEKNSKIIKIIDNNLEKKNR